MRTKLFTLTFIASAIVIFVGSIYNNGHSSSSGAPSGFTGSPGDGGNTCATSGCHSNYPVGIKTKVFTSNIPTDGYVPGTTYTITATARSSTNRNTFGFQISPQTSTGVLVGTLIATNAGTSITGSGKYLTHNSNGITGINGVKSWSFNWVAPAAGTGNVTFYGAFNHANGNGSTSGDSIFKSTYVISEKVQAPIVNIGDPAVTICYGSFITLDAGNPGSTYRWTKDNVQIATTKTINASTAGKYKVVVTNSGGASAADSVQLSVAPAFTISIPDRNLCEGSSITLDAGNSGVAYLWSTGATTQTINVSNAGTYTVKVTNSLGCEARDTVIITSVPNPVVNLGSNITVCTGTPVILNAANAGATYLWSTGETTQSIQVNNSGQYIVLVTQNTCSSTDTIQVSFVNLPIVNLGDDKSKCTSDTISLDAGNDGATYLWSTGETTKIIRVNLAGTYSVTVSNANACSATDEILISNLQLPIASYTYQNINGLSVQFMATQQTDHTYSWNFGDPNSTSNTSTLVNPLHEFSSKGSYIVSLTVINSITGCENVFIDTVLVNTNGFNIDNSRNIQLLKAMPNPFVGNTTITYTLKESASTVSLTVFDELGRELATLLSEEKQQAGKYKVKFINEDYNASVYIIRLTVDGESSVYRLVNGGQ